jgi:regulator of sigma E protease
MIFLTVLVFVLIFSVIILIHEAGHFFAAKWSGVKVEEFGIGLPPRAFGVRRGETIYSVNWIPFGGFVRMLGEGGDKVPAKERKRSFESKTLRQKMFIVCAGVIMNLVLAFVLLTIGFTVGIEPLIASEVEFLDAVRDGQVVLDSVSDAELVAFEEAVEAGEPAAEIYYFPRLVYAEDAGSVFAGRLADGDVILQVNGAEVLSEDDLYAAFESGSEVMAFRPGSGEELEVTLKGIGGNTDVLISYLEEGAPADEAGLQAGDVILRVGGQELSGVEDVSIYTQDYVEDGEIFYEILRDDLRLDFSIPVREDGRIGIGLSEMIPAYGDFSLYLTYVPHELVEIPKVSYGLKAPIVATQEIWRLGKLTAVMFVDVLAGFFQGDSVPAGVAGPVGIAQMTFVNMQNGFAAMLRFVALLSLSLGVINILPIPALDGGRAVFIIYEGVTGHKPNKALENFIHSAGFLLLLLFLFYVTFNDVLNLV